MMASNYTAERQQAAQLKLDTIFAPRQDILQGIKRASDTPGKVALFVEIADFLTAEYGLGQEPATKKRKIESGAAPIVAAPPSTAAASTEPVLLEIKELSFSMPQRKKLDVVITQNHFYARAPGTTEPVQGACHAWRDIEYAFFLQVPDKAQPSFNYVLFPRGTANPSKAEPSTVSPVIFTVPATAPKFGTIGGVEKGKADAYSDDYKTLVHWAINTRLQAVGNPVKIVSGDPSKFRSGILASNKKDKPVHVTAYRGSKDGYLFFLENGILWAFKKPILFLPFKDIVSVSFTNILQVTFSMVIEIHNGNDEDTEEIEFSMIDQQDYNNINGYVAEHDLQDRSMAEQRRGKIQLAENKAKKGANGEEANGDSAAGNGTSELAKAQEELEQGLQDDEDEDEEDYDPGSDGESEGSGSSSGEDSDDDDQDGEGGEDDDEDEEMGEGEGEEDAGDDDDEGAPRAGVPVRSGFASIGGSKLQ